MVAIRAAVVVLVVKIFRLFFKDIQNTFSFLSRCLLRFFFWSKVYFKTEKKEYIFSENDRYLFLGPNDGNG